MDSGAAGPEKAPQRLPRGLSRAALPLASLALVAIFVLALFPYERFRDPVVAGLAQATGASVSLEKLGGGPSLGGPSLTATKLLLRWPGRGELLMERAHLRPAWSLSWLRGVPALYLKAEGPAGRVAGTVWPSTEPAFAGRLRDVDLSMLPLEDLGSPVVGRLDAEVDIRAAAGGPIGEIRFEASDGSIAFPEMPFGVPYQSAQGLVERGESGSIVVHELELEGPMLSLKAEGSVGSSRGAGGDALDLEIKLVAVEPGLRELLRPYGFRFDADGIARHHLGGTRTRPRLR